MQSFFYLKFNPISLFEGISNSFKSFNKKLFHQFTHGGFFGIIFSFIFFFLNLLFPIFLVFFIFYYNIFNIFEFIVDSFKGLANLRYLFLPILYISALIALVYIGFPVVSFIVSLVINILIGIWNFILFLIGLIGFVLAWIWLILKYAIIVAIVIGAFVAIYQINEDSYGDSIFFPAVGTLIGAALIIFLFIFLADSYLGGFTVPTLFKFLTIIGGIV